ncbi:MAG: hypothetical protein P8P83_03510 [Rickettsiaceae bacterium]|nr:hypothetical protein [Rickettsiaceae bacterium]
MSRNNLNIILNIGKSMLTGIPHVIAVGSSKAYHSMVSATSQCMTSSVKESDLTEAQKAMLENAINQGADAASKVKIEKHVRNELEEMIKNNDISKNNEREDNREISPIIELTPAANEAESHSEQEPVEAMLQGAQMPVEEAA